MTDNSGDEVLAAVQVQYEQLSETLLAHIKEIVGKRCREHNLRFDYYGWVLFRMPIDESDVGDDGGWIHDPSVMCYQVARDWYVEHLPDKRIVDLLAGYEDMFGNLPQCICEQGEWLGL